MPPKILYLPGFLKDENSFAHWLALELAATIYGNKPSTVLSFSDTKSQPLLKLWKQYGPAIIGVSAARWIVLRETSASITILFYHPASLRNCIENNEHREFLRQRGYQIEQGLEQCLLLLRQRYQYTCPPEIGLLLGIPLKDVLGFMGLNRLPLSCRGLWCVYGDPEGSLSAMRRFMDDRRNVAEQLGCGRNPYQVLCG